MRRKSKPSTGTSGGSTSTKSKPSTSTSSGAASTKSKSSSGLPAKKSYSSSRYSDGYDDGYDDVYSDGEPDWDRYDTDDDYARGADDALDEYEEYGEDW